MSDIEAFPDELPEGAEFVRADFAGFEQPYVMFSPIWGGGAK
ncbi:hypothetical protein AAIB41_14305 [Brucella sp. BE17]